MYLEAAYLLIVIKNEIFAKTAFCHSYTSVRVVFFSLFFWNVTSLLTNPHVRQSGIFSSRQLHF